MLSMSLKMTCWKSDDNRKASDYLAISRLRLHGVASRPKLGTVYPAHLLQAKKTHLITASLRRGSVGSRLASAGSDFPRQLACRGL
jgi:hypothetical protein